MGLEIEFNFQLNNVVQVAAPPEPLLEEEAGIRGLLWALKQQESYKTRFLIPRKAVRDTDLWFYSRLSLNLVVPVPEKILVSKVRVGDFKEWFMKG